MEFDEKAETETRPAFEIHLGETSLHHSEAGNNFRRYCIIWINGKRWEGHLTEGEEE